MKLHTKTPEDIMLEYDEKNYNYNIKQFVAVEEILEFLEEQNEILANIATTEFKHLATDETGKAKFPKNFVADLRLLILNNAKMLELFEKNK